jgi:hypothetical protein
MEDERMGGGIGEYMLYDTSHSAWDRVALDLSISDEIARQLTICWLYYGVMVSYDE